MGIGGSEMIILMVIALLLFGKRLPEVARSLGKGMSEFKKGLAGIEGEIHSATSLRQVSSPAYSRPIPPDERDEVTVPKFEPPRFEPPQVGTVNPA